MNILLIGNGFDLAQGLPTKYTDFLEWVVEEWDFFLELKRQNSEITSYKEMLNLKVATDKQRKSKIDKRIEHQKELWDCIDDNIWIEYFLQCDMYRRENWIDFEREISNVIQSLDYDIFSSKEKSNINDNIGDLSNAFLNKKYGKYTYSVRAMNALIGKGPFESISFKTIRDKLLNDLNKFIRAFEIYLTEYIAKIKCSVISPDLKDILIVRDNSKEELGCNILSFNYTNTCQKIYLDSLNIDLEKYIDFIHGKADINNTIESNNMVLGIDEYLPEDRRNKDVEFIGFKKFYQRIYKGTGCKYKKWVDRIKENENIDHELYIFGHSLDVTDGDVLRDLILNDNVYTTIFYLNKDVMGQQIANLVKVIGQDELIRRTGGSTKTIEFKLQQEMIEV